LESAKNILARIYREGREPKEQDEQIVRSFWAPTVGAQIASRTQPIRLYRGRLVVDVEGHDWRRQLAAMSREITAKLNAALGKTVLEGIDFRVKVPAARPPRRASAAEEMDEANAGSAGNRTRRTSRKRRQA
jgi:predicted nucleic acid-binding Zn ribbon protein